MSGASVPTEHQGKISGGPITIFGVSGITGHTSCRTMICQLYFRIRYSLRMSRKLSWTMGLKRIKKIRTEHVRARAGVAVVNEKIKEVRLRWLGYVERKAVEDVVTRTWKMEVNAQCKRGRPKLRCGAIITSIIT